MEQNTHLGPTRISEWPKKSDVVRIMILNKKMTKIRNKKILIGFEPLKKNGKMKNTIPSIPPLVITKSVIPSIIHRTPNDRKF